MPSFPAIREPLAEGWARIEPDGVRRTAMDAGPEKARVESTGVPAQETLRFKLNETDRDLLRAAHAAHKAERLDWTHPLWGAVQVKFRSPPQWSKTGPWFVANVQLDIYH